MRASRWIRFAVVVLAGCGDIIGLDGYGEPDGSVIDSSTSDVVGDVTPDVIGDAGSDVVCAHPSFTCVPSLPTGWTWAIYSEDARPSCATGYATPTDVEEGIDAAAATCTCGCTTTDPTCGSVTITAGTNGSCNNITNQTDPADASCNNVTSFTTGADISVTAGKPSGGSCAPTPTETVPPVGYDHEGRTCSLADAATGGCASGNVCVPNPAPFTTCVSQTGMQACPTGFSVQHLVGTTPADTRGCTPCTCAFDAGTCGGSASFYTVAGCTKNQQKIPVDGVCTAVTTAHTWVSFTYASTTTASCAAATVAPDGGVDFSDLTTVCCTN
jgi:hypothetical protein